MSAALEPTRFIDLTHVLHNAIPTWDPGQGFLSKQLWSIEKEGAVLHEYRFLKAGVGTHMDSAGHIVPNRRFIHQYGCAELVSPLCIIDVRQQAQRDSDYGLSSQDVLNWERQHGRVPRRSLVLMDSGWTQYFSDPVKYLSFDSQQRRHFPGFGLDAAQLLLERGINSIAVDTMSIDVGPSEDFAVHKAVLGADLYAVENVKIVDGLPAVGATIVVAPLLVEGGSESPCRVYAYV